MTVITALVYFAGSLVCHQIPERSFHVSGLQLPVCARCTGLYVSAALGAIVFLAMPARPLTFARMRTALIVAAIPTLVTLATAWLRLWDPGNVVRALTATPLGVVVGAIAAAALARRLR